MVAQIHSKAEQVDVLSLREHTEKIASTLERLDRSDVLKEKINEIKNLIESRLVYTSSPVDGNLVSGIDVYMKNIQTLKGSMQYEI